MRPPVAALRAQLRKSTQEAREAKAADLYALEKVRLVLAGRASGGFEFAVIEAPDGLDLRFTEAGKTAKAWFEKEKLHVAWEARSGGLGDDGASSYSLVISWQVPALSLEPAPGEGGPGQRGIGPGAEPDGVQAGRASMKDGLTR